MQIKTLHVPEITDCLLCKEQESGVPNIQLWICDAAAQSKSDLLMPFPWKVEYIEVALLILEKQFGAEEICLAQEPTKFAK